MKKYANTTEVNPSVLDAIAKVESNFNPSAINRDSGAMGMYQFLPSTAKDLGIDPMNPHEARRGAEQYFGWLLERTGDFDKALAAYNWGIGNVEKKGMGGLPKETRDYIAKIHKAMGSEGEKARKREGKSEIAATDQSQPEPAPFPIPSAQIDPKLLVALMSGYSPSSPWGSDGERPDDETANIDLLADDEPAQNYANGGLVAPFGVDNTWLHPKNAAKGPFDIQWNMNNMMQSANARQRY